MNATILLSTLCLAAAPLALGAPAGDAPAAPESQQPNELRTYDLQALGMERQCYTGPMRVLPASLVPELGACYERLSVLGPDDVLEQLYYLCGEELEFEGRSIWLDEGGKAVVRAPRAVQERVARALAFLTEVLGRRVEVRVDVLDFPSRFRANAMGKLGVLDAAGVQRLRESATNAGGRVQTFTLAVASGTLAYLDAGRSTEVLADYDVEVAQGSFIHDPHVQEFLSGTRLWIDCSPAREGMSLFVGLQTGAECGEPREVDLSARGLITSEAAGGSYIEGPRTLQAFSTSQRGLFFEAGLPAGGALALQTTLDLEEAQGPQVILVQPQGAPPAFLSSLDDEFYALDGAALSMPRLYLSGSHCDRTLSEWGLGRLNAEYDPLLQVERDPSSPGLLWELLGSQRPDLDIDNRMSWFLLRPDAATQSDLREEGRELPSLASVLDSILPHDDTVLLDVSLTRAGSEGSHGVSATLPVRTGRPAVLSLGVEGTRLRDFDVEIAQASAVAAPIVDLYLDGLALSILPYRRPDGALALEVRGMGHLLADGKDFSAGGPTFREVEERSFDQLLIDQTVVLSEGRGSVVIGDSAATPRPGSLRLDLTVR